MRLLPDKPGLYIRVTLSSLPRDEFSLIVKDSSGKVIANVSGQIAGGNIQSTRLH